MTALTKHVWAPIVLGMLDLFESLDWKIIARKSYSISKLTKGVVTELDELWPEVPAKFRAHTGNVVVDGSALFGTGREEDNNLFVIDGNLTVKGTLGLRQDDCYGILYVTGSVSCEDCICEVDAGLIVGGSLSVKRLLVTHLHDQGLLIVHGAIAGALWLEARGRGFIDFDDLRVERLFYSDDPEHYEAAARGAEDGEVSYLFDVKRAKHASTILRSQFLDGAPVNVEKLGNAMRSGKLTLR